MADLHNERLQSLRGLAALCVLGGHSALLTATNTAILTQQLFQPNAAVVLFYVLSGYVLSLSLTRDDHLMRFAVRRLFRILPVYWIGIFVSCSSYLVANHPAIEGSTPWFNGTIVGSAGAVHWPNIWTTSMSGVLWSVQVELFTAPFIPLMLYISRRLPLVVDILIVILLTVIMLYLRPSPLLQAWPQLMFVPYLVCFYLGVMLPKLLVIEPLRRLFQSAVLALGALLLSIYVYGHTPLLHIDFYGYLVICVFISGWLVAYAAASQPARSILSWRPLVWLGDVSYSFYAYGTPIMMAIGLGVFLVLPASWRTSEAGSLAIILLTFAISLAVTLPLAAISYGLIERNANGLGRRLARSIRPIDTSTAIPEGIQAPVSQ
jgi:peptidoglycan/LPS O-acetylase OafA/YrhL